jgi:hypothetical protein
MCNRDFAFVLIEPFLVVEERLPGTGSVPPA